MIFYFFINIIVIFKITRSTRHNMNKSQGSSYFQNDHLCWLFSNKCYNTVIIPSHEHEVQSGQHLDHFELLSSNQCQKKFLIYWMKYQRILTVFCHLVNPYEYLLNQTMMHLFTCFTETMRSDISSSDKLEYSGSIRLGATSITDPRLQYQGRLY